MLPVRKTIELTDYLKKINIMLVDNDPMLVGLMTRILKYLGFRNIFTAADGFSAIHEMYEHDIDLIITDWELHPVNSDYMAVIPPNPVLRSERWSPVAPTDGGNFVKYLRASKYSPSPYISIIMLTGLGIRDHIEYARDTGVNEVILKPVSIETLYDRIAALIDAPRPFVTSRNYKGPCRRRQNLPFAGEERRKHDIKIFKHDGY